MSAKEEEETRADELQRRDGVCEEGFSDGGAKDLLFLCLFLLQIQFLFQFLLSLGFSFLRFGGYGGCRHA